MERIRRMSGLFVLLLAACEEKGDAPPPVTENDASQQIAVAWCDFVFSCDCDRYGYPDREFCVDSERALVDGYFDAARRAGLTFAPECAQMDIDAIADDECISDPWGDFEGTDDQQCAWCNYYHGDKKVGESCTAFGEFDDCDQGLYCEEGECVDPCAFVSAGEPCQGGWPSDCAEGYHCPSSNPVCTPIPGEGEACELECGEGLYCTFDAICARVPVLGQPCDYDCGDGLGCSFEGVCIELPGAGEACTLSGSGCAAGLYCDYGDGVDLSQTRCVEHKAEGEPCAEYFECASADCLDGACAPLTASVCE